MLTPGSVLPAPACAPGRPMERPIRVWSTMSALAIAATAFVLIFPIELPDKTFSATLVLATRYKPLAVWVGVTAAFLVQTIVACTLGGLLAHLPRPPVEVVAGRLFLVGAVLLWRAAAHAEADEA